MFGCTSYDHDLGLRAEDSTEGGSERPRRRSAVRCSSTSQAGKCLPVPSMSLVLIDSTDPELEHIGLIPSLILTYPTPEHSRSSEFAGNTYDPEEDRRAIGEFTDRRIGQVVEGSLLEHHGYNRRLWPDAVESSVFTEYAHENTSFPRCRRIPHPLADKTQPAETKKRWSLASHTTKRSTASTHSSSAPWRRLSAILSAIRPSKLSTKSRMTVPHSTTCPGPPRHLEVSAILDSCNNSGQGCDSERERDTGTSTLDPARAAGKDEESIKDRAGGKDIRSRLRRLPGRIFVFRDEVASITSKRFNFLLRSNGEQPEDRRRHSLPPDFAFN
jgi:hypothetical protein